VNRIVAAAAALSCIAAAPRFSAQQQAAPQAPPAILSVALSATHVARRTWWSGHILTTTNVASVVISMPFFSFEVPRRSFGDFAFRTFVGAVPPLYRQTLYGSVIAYNAAGVAVSRPIVVTFE
jgi:hypothetical protein